MKRQGSPMLLFETLDLRPLFSILWKGLHFEGTGRPVKYDPEYDLRALMLRQLSSQRNNGGFTRSILADHVAFYLLNVVLKN